MCSGFVTGAISIYRGVQLALTISGARALLGLDTVDGSTIGVASPLRVAGAPVGTEPRPGCAR